MDTCVADIVVLTETWLLSEVKNCELFSCEKKYTVYRHDRSDRSGGGVLIAVSEGINSYVVPIQSELEFLCTCVTLNHHDVIVCACYRPLLSAPTFCDELYDCLNKVVSRHPKAPIFLMGDFNFPGIQWYDSNPIATTNSSECIAFIDLCSTFNLSQLVQEPTRVTPSCANVLDLVLTNYPDFVSSLTLLPGSPYNPLYYAIALAPQIETFENNPRLRESRLSSH